MKISIITATYNRAATIGHTIRSLQSQDYSNFEHIIVDGGSTDGSLDIINKLKSPNMIVISEPDKGIYDAWNKGLSLATGDVIGFLNSDDYYTAPDILSMIVAQLIKSQKSCVFGDIQYVAPDNLEKVTRYYSSQKFEPTRLALGYMPAHPALYAKREVYDIVGKFSLDYEIAADFEYMVRVFHSAKTSYHYIARPFVNMRTGGISTASLKNRITMIRENVRACKENNLNTSFLNVFANRFFKLLEFK